MKKNSDYSNKMKADNDDNLEFVLQAVADTNFAQSKVFQEWLLESERHAALYKECLFYREATLKTDEDLIPDINGEWQKFNKQNISRMGKQRFKKIWLYSSVAAAILIIVLLIPLQRQHNISRLNKQYIAMATVKKNINQPNTGITNIKLRTKVKVDKVYIDKTHNMISKSVGKQNTFDKLQANVEELTFNVPKGKSYQLSLEDGTKVWVNTDTKIIYPVHFDKDKREVKLIGEAYFKVAKEKDRPFIVETPYLTTLDIGTEFDVRAYKRENASVTLVEGKVAVCRSGYKDDVLLSPGENAYLSNTGIGIKVVDTKNYTSWMDGYFYYNSSSLQEIMNDLSRWYNVNVVFKEQGLKNLRFKFWAKREDSFANVVTELNQTGKVSIRMDAQGAVVYEP